MRRMFEGRGTTVAAFLAGIMVATAGTAAAARLITGRQIKDGSITAKDLSKALRAQLARAGKQGPAGAPGVQGAAGAAGATGAPGAPGLVRAFAHVAPDGSLDQSRDSRGIVSSRRDGSYTCVKLDPSIDAARAVPAVTPDLTVNFSFSAPGAIGWVAVNTSSGCTGANEIRVAMGTYGATVNSGVPVVAPGAFFLLVP